MQIIIDTSQPITEADAKAVFDLLKAYVPVTPAQPTDTPEALEAEAKKRATTPPAKKAPAKKAASAAPKKEPEAPAPEKAESDSEVAQTEPDEALRDKAKAAAKAAMDDGNRDAVVAALAAVGEKRVTTMKDENLAAFIEALSAELDNLV